jgi:Fe2+ or Zn2+ uptake regulation protein
VFSISYYFSDLQKLSNAARPQRGHGDGVETLLKVKTTSIPGRIQPQTAAVNRVRKTAPEASARHLPSLTKNYRLIYDIVEKSGVGRHLTTSDIYAQALKQRPGIGFVTVYRGLGRLRELGLVCELYIPGAGAATYEPSGSRHAHFRCTECGEIKDVDFTIAPRTIAAIASQHDFDIESESVTFAGRCAACARG